MGIGEGALLFAGKLRRHEEDLRLDLLRPQLAVANRMALRPEIGTLDLVGVAHHQPVELAQPALDQLGVGAADHHVLAHQEEAAHDRSEEHTSELQSLMRISYAVFCLKKKKPTELNQAH